MPGGRCNTTTQHPLWGSRARPRLSCCVVVTAMLLLASAAPLTAPTGRRTGAGRLHHFKGRFHKLVDRGGTAQVRVQRAQSAAAVQAAVAVDNGRAQQRLDGPVVDVPLVTGCGRGGTHATAAILREAGVRALHEGFSARGVSVGWPYAAPMDARAELPWNWPPAGRYPFEQEQEAAERLQRLRKFSPVVLLVRHPLDVIASVRRCFCAKGSRSDREINARNDNRSWYWVESNLNVTEFLPSVDSWAALAHDDVLRAMAYWVGWNLLVEEHHTLQLAGYDDHDDGAVGDGDDDDTDESSRRQRLLERVRRSSNHTVQLEDPLLPLHLTRLLNLSQAVQSRAAKHRMHNTKDGQSNVSTAAFAAAKETWADVHRADAALAQRMWAMAQRYGYETEHPPLLADFLR